MADNWIATSTIHHGEGEQVKSFDPGEEVKGLPDDVMKRYIEIGTVQKPSVLRRREAPGEPSEEEKGLKKALQERDEEIAALRAELANAQGSREANKGAQTTTPPTPNK